MSVGLPATIWRPTSGNGEMGIAGDDSITTISGLLLTTLSSRQLITLTSTYTPLPATVWTENDAL